MSIPRRTALARTAAAVAAAALTAGGLALVAPPATAATPGHASRVVSGQFPDPGFTKVSGRYYLYRTGGGFGGTSSTHPQSGYGAVRSVMPKRPAWVSQDPKVNPKLWAPDVFSLKDGVGRTYWVMYFTGVYPKTGTHCIGVATSASPSGPFADTDKKPVVCSGKAGYEAIDPSAYHAKDGKRYMLYKVNYQNTKNFSIRAIQMNTTTAATTVGTYRTKIFQATAKMEAPSAISHGGSVWIFTSRGNYADCTYSTDVWRAPTLWGGTFKRVRTVMSSKSTGLCGPGGATVLQDGKTTRIAFHAWHGGTLNSGGVRQAWVGELRWNSSGPYLY